MCVLPAVLLVAGGTALMSRHLAEDEAEREARARTVGIARGIAAPLVNEEVREGAPQAVEDLGTVLRHRMQDGSVAHVVLYDRQGWVLWSDDPTLLGTRDLLRPEILRATAAGDSVVTHTTTHPSSSRASRRDGSMLGVYVGVLDADGKPFVFVAHTPREQLEIDAGHIFGNLLPLTLGSLLLLVVLIMPLALSMARRIDRASGQRSAILRRSLRAWHQERARIAQVLHDDVIQDLSASSYALSGVLMALPDTPQGELARSAGQQVSGALVDSVRTLRSMLADLVPTGLDGSGLVSALTALARRTSDAGLPVRLVVDPGLAPAPTLGGLIYRAVREGLLNVRHHADATRAAVQVRRLGDSIEITIDDDGHGPAPEPSPAEGHMGLRLLGRLFQDVGGSVELAPGPAGGARLRVVLPAELPDLEGDTRS